MPAKQSLQGMELQENEEKKDKKDIGYNFISQTIIYFKFY